MIKSIGTSVLAIFLSALAFIGCTQAAEYADFPAGGQTPINNVRMVNPPVAERYGTSTADSTAKAQAKCDSDTRCVGYYVHVNDKSRGYTSRRTPLTDLLFYTRDTTGGTSAIRTEAPYLRFLLSVIVWDGSKSANSVATTSTSCSADALATGTTQI